IFRKLAYHIWQEATCGIIPNENIGPGPMPSRRTFSVQARPVDDPGWPAPSPKVCIIDCASMSAFLGHVGSVEFSKLLLSDAKVAVAPGSANTARGYVRIALVENRKRLRSAVRSIKRFMVKSVAAHHYCPQTRTR